MLGIRAPQHWTHNTNYWRVFVEVIHWYCDCNHEIIRYVLLLFAYEVLGRATKAQTMRSNDNSNDVPLMIEDHRIMGRRDWRMNEWTNGLMDGWSDRRMDEWTNGLMDGWSDRRIDGWANGRMDWWTDDRMIGWTVRQMEGWTTKRADWRKYKHCGC